MIEKEWARARAPKQPEPKPQTKTAQQGRPASQRKQAEKDKAMTAQAPNILIVMADQMAPAFLPIYGHPLTQAPNMMELARSGVVFDSAYCASPLCSPSRASFMAGRLPSRTRVYDNAAEFAADIPTFAHHLPASRLSHHSVGQDALLRSGPAARLRGAADDRHLPRRLRLDARLGPPATSGRAGITT